MNLFAKAAIDIGNDSIKATFSENQTVSIPNILAEMKEDRKVKKYEDSILDGIHLSIISGALKKKSGI